MSQHSTNNQPPRVVLVTGLSGSGKSIALNVLEDVGYYCIDNLPVSLFEALVRDITIKKFQEPRTKNPQPRARFCIRLAMR